MSVVQVNQLRRRLQQTYDKLIDLSDVKNESDLENCFLSRSYAAFSLEILADISPEEASKCLTDSYDDNGIDALYYDQSFNDLWIVQSKWIKNGKGEPSMGDVSKFVQGIKDLLELKYERFNDIIRDKEVQIEEALSNIKINLRIVLAYTGSDTLADPSSRIIDDLLEEVNEASNIMDFTRFTLKQAIGSLVNLLSGLPITHDLLIKNWERIENPYKAVIGIIDGVTLGQLWIDNRVKLLSDNIRDFIGNSVVNVDIKRTALEEPEHFLYYNNGVTILCDDINKMAIGGTDHAMGSFRVENIKVVNGAQTVGSLGEAYKVNSEAVEKVNVFVKIISLKDCPTDFGNEVTMKTNTQNRIEKRDFVSLDPQHERLKTDLALDNINYQIKRTSTIQKDENSCDVEELITAVACSLQDVDIAITAKREVGKLWENIHISPYIDIVNSNLNAIKAWRCIQIMRAIQSFIKSQEKSKSGRERSCLIHSNRFVLHIILNLIDQQLLNDPKSDFDSFCQTDLEPIISNVEGIVYEIVENEYSSSLMHQIFRNFTKSRNIKDLLMNRLQQN